MLTGLGKMNKEARRELRKILQKADEDVNSVTVTERAFLRARRDYLKNYEKEEYKDLLTPPAELNKDTKVVGSQTPEEGTDKQNAKTKPAKSTK